MNISEDESKWQKFSETGSVLDYLSYKGVMSGETKNADDN